MQAHSPLMPSNQSGHVVMTTDLTNGNVTSGKQKPRRKYAYPTKKAYFRVTNRKLNQNERNKDTH